MLLFWNFLGKHFPYDSKYLFSVLGQILHWEPHVRLTDYLSHWKSQTYYRVLVTWYTGNCIAMTIPT